MYNDSISKHQDEKSLGDFLHIFIIFILCSSSGRRLTRFLFLDLPLFFYLPSLLLLGLLLRGQARLQRSNGS